MDRCPVRCPAAGHLVDRYQADKFRSDTDDQPQKSHVYLDFSLPSFMDRYRLSREFRVTMAKQKVRRIDDVHALQQLCCELLESNFHLRECLRQATVDEIPEKTSLRSAYLLE